MNPIDLYENRRYLLSQQGRMGKVISPCWKRLRCRSRRKEGTRVELKLERLCEWKWRRWLLAGVLWLAQVFMTSAYSLISSFFPIEVVRLILYADLSLSFESIIQHIFVHAWIFPILCMYSTWTILLSILLRLSMAFFF